MELPKSGENPVGFLALFDELFELDLAITVIVSDLDHFLDDLEEGLSKAFRLLLFYLKSKLRGAVLGTVVEII